MMIEPEKAILDAQALRRMMAEKEAERAAAAAAKRRAQEEEERHRREMFMNEHLSPDMLPGLMRRIEAAAANGQHELLLGTFPSAWLTDRGRAVNAGDPAWPHTLTGIMREFYAFYLRHLHPHGYHLRLEVITFPEGMLGDVGVFLSW
jgi:hypothetical protein